MICHLIMLVGFVCLYDPGSYVVRGNLPLVESPKANWCWVSLRAIHKNPL